MNDRVPIIDDAVGLFFLSCRHDGVRLNTDGRRIFASPPASVTPDVVHVLTVLKPRILALPRVWACGRWYFVVDLGDGAFVFSAPTLREFLEYALAEAGWPAIEGMAEGEEDWRVYMQLVNDEGIVDAIDAVALRADERRAA